MNLFDIEGRVIAITGGTGVLGREISEYLALQNATVVLMGRDERKGEAAVSAIRAKGGQADFERCDVTDPASVDAARDSILGKHGRVDALLNAAGGNMPGATAPVGGDVLGVSPEAFDKVLRVNLTGTLIATQSFLRPMAAAGRGSVVNFSSMAAFRPLTRVAGYAAAKAGVSNLTAFLATEAATKFTPAIRVNAVAPGFFLTEQNRSLLTNADGTLTQRGADVIRQTPFRRFGKPEELCGTVHYLVSDASSFVTGAVAVVDGGFNVYSI